MQTTAQVRPQSVAVASVVRGARRTPCRAIPQRAPGREVAPLKELSRSFQELEFLGRRPAHQIPSRDRRTVSSLPRKCPSKVERNGAGSDQKKRVRRRPGLGRPRTFRLAKQNAGAGSPVRWNGKLGARHGATPVRGSPVCLSRTTM